MRDEDEEYYPPNFINMCAVMMRILMIEDDQEVSGFIAKGLKEARHQVDIAENGKDGLAIIKTLHALLQKYNVQAIAW